MDPRPLCAVGLLEGADLRVALQRQRDLVETFKQSGAAARIDFETVPCSRGRRDGLLLQIDGDAHASVSAQVKALIGVYGVYDVAQMWQRYALQSPRENNIENFMGTAPMDDPLSNSATANAR